MPQPVYERFVTYLQREREIGGYEAQAEYQPEVEGAYRRLADLIAARPSELALVGSASRAFQFGLSALSLPACRPAVAWSTSSDLLGARYGTALNAA
jgi:cysteine desulfurase/selenocysteine lyase